LSYVEIVDNIRMSVNADVFNILLKKNQTVNISACQ